MAVRGRRPQRGRSRSGADVTPGAPLPRSGCDRDRRPTMPDTPPVAPLETPPVALRDAPAAATATEVFVAHRELLFAVVYNLLGSVADAEDVLQETWLA